MTARKDGPQWNPVIAAEAGAATDAVPATPWKATTLAGVASYLDPGTIVAVSASLSVWQARFGLSAWQVGFLSAALTVCVGIGSIVGGRIGDRFGRKRVYSVDLLCYAFGLLWLVFAVGPPMLFVGVVIIGLAIGADVPTALALVGELSPAAARGRLVTFTQFLWALGPLVVLVLVLFATGLGELMPRVIFGHLVVIAVVTWSLRRRMKESVSWERAARDPSRPSLRRLLDPSLLRATLFTIVFYTLLTMGSNFYGSFGLYALEKVGGLSPSGALEASLVAVPVIVVTALAMMRAMDTRARRPMFSVGAVLQVLAWLALLVLPVGAPTLIGAFVLYGCANTLAGEAHYKVWSQESFPTTLRGSATGLSFGIARIASAVFLIFVPPLLLGGFTTLVVLMVAVTALSGILGVVFQPRTRGESIADIDARLAADER